jgi:hypothetical protein
MTSFINCFKRLALCLFLAIFVVDCSTAKAQTAEDTIMSKMVALRDDFIGKISAMGFTPSLKAPEIVADNPRSFGNYDDSTNILHTGNWKTLPANLQAIFKKAASEMGNGMSGQLFFELGTHQWVFIHELGHWWRACQHQKAAPYEDEMAANRIATAYWRERDSAFLSFMVKRFQYRVDNTPSPVPAAQSKEKYLNDNYDKLPGASAYTWYQAIMIIDAYKERPVVTFKNAIEREGRASDK